MQKNRKSYWMKCMNFEKLKLELEQSKCEYIDRSHEFESYVGTDKENLDVTDERLEQIFDIMPDKELLTKKEYKALLDNIYRSYEDDI